MAKKESLYNSVYKEIAAVIEGEDNEIAKMTTVACLLSLAFDDFFWTGFYLTDPLKERELVVGPYQGTLGCLRISYDRGVCGAAAKEQRTQVVEDVHSFPSHIACDRQTNSEIVVPVLGKRGKLIGVLDVDSTKLGRFDDVDKYWLEKMMKEFFAS
jgi:GAF domain-containing protein